MEDVFKKKRWKSVTEKEKDRKTECRQQKVFFFNLNLWVHNEMIVVCIAICYYMFHASSEMWTISRINQLESESANMRDKMWNREIGMKCSFTTPPSSSFAMNIHINSLLACSIWTIHLHLINQQIKLNKIKNIYKIKPWPWYSLQ